jgi:RNA polymerase sigma factor (sigma-70 family)
MKNGDLAARHMPDALSMAEAFHTRCRSIDLDDLKGAAIDGLIKAALAYRNGSGVPFWAYGHRRVKGQMFDLVDWRRRRPEEPLPLHVHASGLTSNIPVLHRAIAALPSQFRAVLVLRFFEGLTMRELSRRLGLTYQESCHGSYGWVLQRQALNELRQELARRGVRKLSDVI